MSELRKEIRNGEKVWFSPSGKELVSVTQVIQEAGLMSYKSSPIDNPWVTKGTQVHDVIEEMNGGKKAPEGSLNDNTAGYIVAYDKFLKESGFKLKSQEVRHWSEDLGICGKYDLLGFFPGDPGLALVDIKTGKPAKWHPIQTAGYGWLTDKGYLRYALYLAGDGTYRLDKHEDPRDFNVFHACLTVVKFKRRKGIQGWLRNQQS